MKQTLMQSITIFPGDKDWSSKVCGGKGASLCQLLHWELPVPDFFIITPEAFNLCIDAGKIPADYADELNVFSAWDLCEAVRTEIKNALDRFQNQSFYSVRSSAVDEDGAEHSFAGQLESYLNVSADDVPGAVIKVWQSGFSERLRAYRTSRGLGKISTAPAVIVQKMIPADFSGIAFSRNPVKQSVDSVIISGVPGLGSSLVSGENEGDTWTVDREGNILDHEVAERTWYECAVESGGSRRVDMEEGDKLPPRLVAKVVSEVAAMALQLESRFGCPQDVEWCVQGEKIWLLQSRPITTLPASNPVPDTPGSSAAGMLNIWDNSNIAESYNGVTTPLTFSFARYVYEEVYQQFCIILGVSRKRVEAAHQVFARMLGLIRGRIYYNLLNWYRVLAMLPGFKLNRTFMEQMMGVKEALPDEIVQELEQESSGILAKTADVFALIRSLAGLAWQYFRLPVSSRKFRKRLDRALHLEGRSLNEFSPDELAAHYRNLEKQLLRHWDAPLVNDFFAMIFFGLLRKNCVRWGGDAGESLANDLVSGEGGMISTEPVRLIREMGAYLSAHEEWLEAFRKADPKQIEQIFDRDEKLSNLVENYLTKFGERSFEELKLESPTLLDDPAQLYRSIAAFANAHEGSKNVEDKPVDRDAIREEKLQAIFNGSLDGKPIRRLVFRFVLRQAVRLVRERENLRFERTRLFGRVRRIFLEFGRHLVAVGALDQQRDVFYLTVEEVLGFVEGTAVTLDFPKLVEIRKREFETFRTEAEPPGRFTTRGWVYRDNDYGADAGANTAEKDASTASAPDDGSVVHGLGCCAGIVRGRVRVVRDPVGVVIHKGEILVAARTDPGWVMLFPSAAGLLVQHGSLLSHSAIVARELGLPAIVAISGLMERFQTGDEVEMDGERGVIRIIRRIGDGKADDSTPQCNE